MRKQLVLAVVLALASPVFAVSAFASAYSGNSAILNANNEVGVAATGTLTNYQEHVPAVYGPSDTETGVTPGFAVKGSYMGNFMGIPNAYAEINYGYSTGDITYKGAVGGSGGYTPYDGTDDMTTNRVMARLGVGFNMTSDMMVTPYIAGGYQEWNRDLKGPYGYTEDYHAGLVGLGAKFQMALSSRMIIGAKAECLAVIGGSMTPNLYNGMYGSAQFGTSGEEVAGLEADYRVVGPVHAYAGMDFTHFNYTGGALNYGAFEPSSSTNQFSMDLGVAYSFS